jgi:predicted transcriptional regulator
MYQLPKKIKVAEIYLGLMEIRYPLRVSVTEVAYMARVGWDYARLVIHELEFHGFLQEPEKKRRAKNNVLGPGQKLSTVQEMFLLCLKTLDPARPLYNYV